MIVSYSLKVALEDASFSFKAFTRKEFMLLASGKEPDAGKESVFDRLESVEGLFDRDGSGIDADAFRARLDDFPAHFVRQVTDAFWSEQKRLMGIRDEAEAKNDTRS